jgi:hypothetical protein
MVHHSKIEKISSQDKVTSQAYRTPLKNPNYGPDHITKTLVTKKKDHKSYGSIANSYTYS